ncbi:hypothetical protein [Mesorhizobium sp. M0488]|uniref:hypothetical protein n=1 Tax=unclassified Mesorhizobium TaxID=325217 RepID=UPI0033354084
MSEALVTSLSEHVHPPVFIECLGDVSVLINYVGRMGLPRQRTDFLILMPNKQHVGFEADHSQHFSRDSPPQIVAFSAKGYAFGPVGTSVTEVQFFHFAPSSD